MIGLNETAGVYWPPRKNLLRLTICLFVLFVLVRIPSLLFGADAFDPRFGHLLVDKLLHTLELMFSECFNALMIV